MKKNSIQACDVKDIQEWYNSEISKTYQELLDVKNRVWEKIKSYNKHMLSNTEKAYFLTKQEALPNRTKLMKEYKQDYKTLTNEYLAIASLYTRKLFLEDKLSRLKKDREWDSKQREKGANNEQPRNEND